MFGLGLGELALLCFLAVLLFGAKRLPALAASVGRSINSFKRALAEKDDQK